MCFNLFVLCSFSCFVCFTFHFVCSVFLYSLCIVSPHVNTCLFSTCVQVYGPLPPGGNLIAVNKYHNNYGIGGARSTRESQGYKDFTGERGGISNINRRIILKYTLKPPQLQVEWTDCAEDRFSVNPAGSTEGNKFLNWPRGY